MVRKCFSCAVIVMLLAAGTVAAQVKISEVSGSPGTFTGATGLAFTATGKIGYVTNPGSGLLRKFRPSTGEILGSAQLPAGIGAVALSPNEKLLVVLGVATQTLYLLDADKLTLIREGGYKPSGFTARNNIIVSPDNTRIYVPDPSRNHVAVFLVADASVERYIQVGVGPNIMTMHPNGRQFGLLCSGKKSGDPESIYMIDSLSSAIIDFRVLDGNAEPFNNVQFTINGSYAFIPYYNDDRIGALDARTFYLSSRVNPGKGPSKILASANGRWLAVANADTDDVALLYMPEGTLAKDIVIPDLDLTTETVLAFSPDSHTLYIPSQGTNEIVAYDVENFKIVRRIATGAGPLRLEPVAKEPLISSLDLLGNVVSLLSLNPVPHYLPHLVQNSKDYAGIALANFSTEPVNVAFYARGDDGALLPGSRNPAIVTARPGEQLSLVLAQVFGFDPADDLDGYLEAYTTGSGVTILYLSGTITQTELDGFVAEAGTGKLLGFPHIDEGMSKFGALTSTEIILLNPGDADASLKLSLYARTAAEPAGLVAYVEDTLPAHARIRKRISDLVPSPYFPLEKAYLEVNSDEPIKGVALVRIGSSLAMVPAGIRGLPDTTFVSAQYASGGNGVLDTPITSILAMANSSPGPITVTAQVTDALGKVIPEDAVPYRKTLAPYESVRGGPAEIFGFPDPLTDPQLHQGTLQITADKTGLLPSLLFGDARDGRYLTAASLRYELGTRFALGHVAEGSFGDPPKRLYTGIAMYNPNRWNTNVEVEAYSPKNELLGRTQLTLQGASRLSRTIGQILPTITQQNGGTVIIKSDLPILIFEVFGSADSDFLVAVPPVVLSP